jgi:hypothetical protein
MRHRAAAASLSAAALTLLLATTAFAGGWANAIADTPPDDPGGPNQPITIGFTLLQHGVTPVDWGTTLVVFTNEASGRSVTVSAEPQGAKGHWAAEVTLPANGTWSTQIRHDLEIVMTGFEPIIIGPAATTSAGSTTAAVQPALLMVAGFLALLTLAAGSVGIVAYRRAKPDRATA